MSTSKTIVFLGPSLALPDAKMILPNACYHAPASCGDILRVLRLNPDQIAIIDGMYETTGAIWHKEILVALEAGVAVFGAASMGALRAAELHQFGMQGIGEIFRQFADGTLTDDDEVAVLHQGYTEGYAPINDAMINIRITLDAAVKNKIIDASFATRLITACKQAFYPTRQLQHILNTFAKTDPTPVNHLKTWLAAGNMIDQKQLDAKTLLRTLAENTKHTASEVMPTPPTKFITRLADISGTTAFTRTYGWLPAPEKALTALQQQDPQAMYFLSNFALLLSKSHHMATQFVETLPEVELESYAIESNLLPCSTLFAAYKENEKLSCLYQWILQQTCLSALQSDTINQYLPAVEKYYQTHRYQILTIDKTICIQMITLLVLLNLALDKHHINIKKSCMTHHFSEITSSRHLNTPEAIQTWLFGENQDAIFPHWLFLMSRFNTAYVNIGGIPTATEALRTFPQRFDWINQAYALCQEHHICNSSA